MGQRSGQGTLLAVLMLGIGMALFSWVASSSLEQRRLESQNLIRKIQIKNLERRLDQAFRSPNFVRENFIQANLGLQEALESALRSPNQAEVTRENLSILDFDGKTWLGFDQKHSTKSRLGPLLEDCPIDNPLDPELEDRCPIVSQVAMKASLDNGVGRVELTVSLSSKTLLLNPATSGNSLKVEFPANLHGVRLEGRRLFCREGFKALMISQAPGDFLCAIQ
jgi:hypothetical protein